MNPSLHSYKFWLEQGKAKIDVGRYDTALASFEKALQLQPRNPNILVWKAGVLTHLKHYTVALQVLDEALSMGFHGPNNDFDEQAVWLFRGVVLQELDRELEAYASYDKALLFEQQKQDSLWQRLRTAFSQGLQSLIPRPQSNRLLARPVGEHLFAAGLLPAHRIDEILGYQYENHHLRFGEIAAMWGWVRQETVDFLVEQWPQLLREKRKWPLGQYLKSAALLSDEQIQAILDQQKSRKGLRFGQIAVRQGWVKQETINFFLKYIP